MARRGVFDLIMNKDEYMEPEQKAVPVKHSDSTTQDPDALVVCPYDKIHRIRVSRFVTHLLKCRKNYTGREMFTCPFNARHVVPKPEARHHVANCPDKAAIEKEMVQGYESNNTYCRGYIKVPSYNTNDDYGHATTENWDEEIDRTSGEQEREYWGPERGAEENGARNHLPRPKGRGTPRAVGHTQPEMRLPREPAQAAAIAHQRHQKIQQQQQSQLLPPHQNHVAAVSQGPNLPQPAPMRVAGLGRGQMKGRVMAANLWGAQPAPQGQGHGAATQNGPSRPGGLGQSSWGDQPLQNGDVNLDDFPPLGGTAQPSSATPLGLGRGLGRGSLLSSPAPPPGLQNRLQ